MCSRGVLEVIVSNFVLGGLLPFWISCVFVGVQGKGPLLHISPNLFFEGSPLPWFQEKTGLGSFGVDPFLHCSWHVFRFFSFGSVHFYWGSAKNSQFLATMPRVEMHRNGLLALVAQAGAGRRTSARQAIGSALLEAESGGLFGGQRFYCLPQNSLPFLFCCLFLGPFVLAKIGICCWVLVPA